MYDRKTWIVLAICGVLISANLFFSAKNPPAPAKSAPITTAEATPGLSVETPPPPTEETKVVLENDTVAFTLSSIGGGIKSAELKNQKNVGDAKTNVLINRHASGPIGGFVDSGKKLENSSFTFKEDQSVAGKSAVFIAKLPTGIIVKKTYSLETEKLPGAEYFLKLNLTIENANTTDFLLSQYGLFLGSAAPLYQKENPAHTGFFWSEKGEMHFEDASSFSGNMFSSKKSIITSNDGEEIEYAGVSDQFFATVIRPEKTAPSRIWGKVNQVSINNDEKTVSAVRAALALPEVSLAPGSSQSLDYRIFIGPKANTMLRKLDNTKIAGQHWGDIMQYGFFWFVSRPLNWLLNTLHTGLDHLSTQQSWGLAVICLTLIVRIIIWPLHAKSTHSMKRMSKLQPMMAALKEKYPDDPTKLNTEMMGLYRKYGINPLGGCLPMFIQIPVFFGFFKMLDYAVELRNQPFLWVDDLSQPDTIGVFFGIPLNLLPIVMAGTSVLQMSMMPKTGDKMQRNIMMLMPLMFFFFCYNYAAALALYWTTQNIFSIGQTWLMNKIPEPELVARKDGGKKTWVQRMAEKQDELSLIHI
jgi:YidC/Oxa1 family membrane protein insertase